MARKAKPKAANVTAKKRVVPPPAIPEEDDNSTELEVSVSEIPKEQKPAIPWETSNARKLLVQDIADGTVPSRPDSSMPTREIFTSRPEYAEYGYALFSSRLSGLRKIVARDKSRADDDEACFNEFRANNIVHTHSKHGYPEWDGSKA
jgi:hypothetical protein